MLFTGAVELVVPAVPAAGGTSAAPGAGSGDAAVCGEPGAITAVVFGATTAVAFVARDAAVWGAEAITGAVVATGVPPACGIAAPTTAWAAAAEGVAIICGGVPGATTPVTVGKGGAITDVLGVTAVTIMGGTSGEKVGGATTCVVTHGVTGKPVVINEAVADVEVAVAVVEGWANVSEPVPTGKDIEGGLFGPVNVERGAV